MSIPVTQFIRRLSPNHLLEAYGDTSGVGIHSIEVPRGCRFDATRSGAGAEFHEAFHLKNQGARIPLDYYPYVMALRTWLFESGVTQLWTEWTYANSRQRWHGVVDASVAGGAKPYGIVEIKVREDAPEDGYVEDWAQLAVYCQLAVLSGRPPRSIWAGLAYVRPQEKMIRMLVTTNVLRLTGPLERLAVA